MEFNGKFMEIHGISDIVVKKVEKRETTNQLLGNQSWLAGKPISFGDFPELRLTKRKGIIQNQLALPQ